MTTPWTIALALLAALVLLALIRVFRGPTAADRVVGLDAINTLVVASMIVFGMLKEQTLFIDVAIVYCLLSYVGVLYIAKYLGKEI